MWEAHAVPFFLGFEGEVWNKKMMGLVIPIPKTDKSIVAVRYSPKRGPSGSHFALANGTDWRECDNILMLAALVQDFIDGYVQQEESKGLVEPSREAEG